MSINYRGFVVLQSTYLRAAFSVFFIKLILLFTVHNFDFIANKVSKISSKVVCRKRQAKCQNYLVNDIMDSLKGYGNIFHFWVIDKNR